ncbi:MAG: PDZ domain-containing protein [Nannocystaceae bacterium]
MLKQLPLTISLLALGAAFACSGAGGAGFTIPDDQLEPGGAFVAYTLGCEKGCDQIVRGDLIQEVDGKKIETGADLDAASITDGAPHSLKVYKQETKSVHAIELVAKPSNKVPPIADAPPFWTTGAARLNEAPLWARRRLFGHGSPQISLVSIDGGIANGRDFYGKKSFFVYFDYGVQSELAHASTFMKVLQKAQSDLQKRGIALYFTQVSLPGRSLAPMNDSDLREFHARWQVGANEGGPLPFIPMYRMPNKTEYNPANELGLEGGYTVIESLGTSPAIVMLDERGIVRWHSEGVEAQPPGATAKMTADVYTMIESVEFALNKL